MTVASAKRAETYFKANKAVKIILYGPQLAELVLSLSSYV